ncbi:M10 family metallopeptidase C-terminal domain-containing protein [Sinorhizobium meliloti]|uniref:M10 family metallopeptidase C-terminal domain-containing protein n=1 Tax=Rhizobium meliloti TaxID=382 RepID=UPI00398CF247
METRATSYLWSGRADRIFGGLGADRFIFKGATESNATACDSIFDFLPGEQDRIDLSKIDAVTILSGDQTFSFISTNSCSGTPAG